MTTRLTETTPGSFRLEITAPWPEVAEDYKAAAARYDKAALPGFRPGKAPPHLIARHYKKDICNEAARIAAVRLTRNAIKSEAVRTIGGTAVLEAEMEPEKEFRCACEFTRRPPVTLADFSKIKLNATDPETRRDEISEWLLANCPCEAPESLIRENIDPAQQAAAKKGDDTWNEAAQNARLLIITREIADRDGVELTDEQFTKRLDELAEISGANPELFRRQLVATGALENLRAFFLTETVLDYIAERAA